MSHRQLFYVRIFEIVFDQLVLPEGFTISIFDGFDDQSPVLKSIVGDAENTPKLPPPFYTTDWLLYVQLSFSNPFASNPFGSTLAERSLGFSVEIRCLCSEATASSCGLHGQCVDGQCHCDAKYTGDFCEMGQLQPPEPDLHCADDQYLFNQACHPLTVCDSDQYSLAAPTKISDRTCDGSLLRVSHLIAEEIAEIRLVFVPRAVSGVREDHFRGCWTGT